MYVCDQYIVTDKQAPAFLSDHALCKTHTRTHTHTQKHAYTRITMRAKECEKRERERERERNINMQTLLVGWVINVKQLLTCNRSNGA